METITIKPRQLGFLVLRDKDLIHQPKHDIDV